MLGWEVTGGAFLWYILPSQLYEIRIGNDIRRKYVCSYSVASGTREGARKAVLGGWVNSTSCGHVSTTGSHPHHCCSPLSRELHWAAGNISCSGSCSQSDPKSCLWERDAHGLHKAPCLPPHIWNPLPERVRVVTHNRVSFPECPLLPESPGALWSGQTPGKRQSAQQEILFQTPTRCLLLKVLVLSPEKGEAFCVVAAVAYTSVCQIFATLLRAEPSWLSELWGRKVNRRDTTLFLSQFAALGNCGLGCSMDGAPKSKLWWKASWIDIQLLNNFLKHFSPQIKQHKRVNTD